MIYELRLPASVRYSTKKPYDTDNHKALLYACEKLKRDDGNVTCAVTDISIYIDFCTTQLPAIIEISSLLTYEVAKLLAPFKIVFAAKECAESWESVFVQIRRQSKARYELHLENHDTHKEPSLFGSSFYLPYEKTPTFFREGILI